MQPIEYLKELSFVRMGGSSEEQKAAKIIANWLNELGYESRMEEFDIYSFNPGEGELTPTQPTGKSIPIQPVGLSANGDVEGELFILDIPYPEWCEPAQLKNRIVLMPHYPIRKWLKLLSTGGALAALTVIQNHRENSVLKLAQSVAKDYGKKIPLASITFKRAISLIHNNIRIARLRTSHENFISSSRNVITELPGESEHLIILTAHYDSTPSSPGAQDNAAGTAELLALANRFSGYKLKRTLRFIFCGSEEMGLVGSEYHTNSNIDQLEKVDLVINLDVGGDPFMPPFARVLGNNEITNYIEGLLKQNGNAAKVTQDIYSSDCMPFASHGIPSISIGRGGIDGKGHSPFDRAENTCNEALIDIVDAAETIIHAVANAKILPFEREISENLKKKVDEYFIERR